jgi:hypothetical protein
MYTAVNYCLNQWEELIVYTTDGNLPISSRLDIDPEAYLEDILRRINTHPASRIDELLPDRWKAEKQDASEDVSLRLESHRPLRRTA